ncbi:MAG: dCTP deaminase [candidate division WS2 bacterium]|nr:dCTP deaminase [Candidatus Lithacetigena glycinireducens]MBT9174772.1 dCTP deaminase [Candidatus Lithacetigena glycinireducens]
MSVLTREMIRQAIKEGRITITPSPEVDSIGPASIDLTMGNEIQVFKRVFKALPVDPEASQEKELLERKTITDSYLLLPGETIIAQTKETVKLAPNLCGWLEGRGRFARLGLDIRIAAGFIQPGVDRPVFFMISNHSPTVLELYPGTRVCQLIIQETLGEARYEGRYR